jgi:hypothetical protein
MKNFKILFLALLTGLIFTACEGENDAIEPATNYLLGKWELREIGGINPSNNVISYEAIVPEGTCGFDTMEFLPNDILTYTEYTSEVATSCDTFIDSGSYSMDVLNLNLSFTLEGDLTPTVINATIDSLTLNMLILTYSDEDGEVYFLKFSKI